MSDAHGRRATREYLWFALLLIVVLATYAVHSPGPDTARQLSGSTPTL
ncbi:MAG: hypothetical protein JWN43_2779 [Gammaproteobacteria bacterium]|nr:hypothetical protein [Gammaproteobacteria bacterium]